MLKVRRGRLGDVPTLAEIYNDAVSTTAATFDLVTKSLEERRGWFEEHDDAHPLVVVESDSRVVGYATFSRFRGGGVGTAAMAAVIEEARALGYHVMVAGIVPPNPASVALHAKLGYKRVGTFSGVGFKFGRWQDVEFYQLGLGTEGPS